MVPVSAPPSEEAREIFTELGYEVTADGDDRFRATREWKQVEVLAVTDEVATGDGGRMRCFVTWDDHVARLERALDADDGDYEWAVIGVSENGDYEVARAPPTA